MQHLFEIFISHFMHPVFSFYANAAAVFKWNHACITSQLFAGYFTAEIISAANNINSRKMTDARYGEQQLIIFAYGCTFVYYFKYLLFYLYNGFFYTIYS